MHNTVMLNNNATGPRNHWPKEPVSVTLPMNDGGLLVVMLPIPEVGIHSKMNPTAPMG